MRHDSTLTGLLKALADPTRRALFERLASGGETSVRVLTNGAGVSQSAVSQHLAMLKEAGLVRERRQGRNAFYRARAERLSPLIDWVSRQDAFWRARLRRLDIVLKEME